MGPCWGQSHWEEGRDCHYHSHCCLLYGSPGSDLSEQEGAGQVIASPGFVGNLCSPASTTLRGPCLLRTWGQSHSARGLFERQTGLGFGIDCNLPNPPETSAEKGSPSELWRSVRSELKSPILLTAVLILHSSIEND